MPASSRGCRSTCLRQIFRHFLNRKFEHFPGLGDVYLDLVVFQMSDYAWMPDFWSELSDWWASNQSTGTTVGEQSSVKCLTGFPFILAPLPTPVLAHLPSAIVLFIPGSLLRSPACLLACSISPPGKRKETASKGHYAPCFYCIWRGLQKRSLLEIINLH